MNQILVTEKLYITPEIKRKKKLYKFEFFISLVVVCVLSSYYIYAEYNKNKDEAVSQEILAGANIVGEDQTTKPTEKLVVMLDNDVNTVGTEDDSAIANLDEETKSVLSKDSCNEAVATSNTLLYTAVVIPSVLIFRFFKPSKFLSLSLCPAIFFVYNLYIDSKSVLPSLSFLYP